MAALIALTSPTRSLGTAAWGASAALAGVLAFAGVLRAPLALLAAALCAGMVVVTVRNLRARPARPGLHELALRVSGDGTWDYDLRAGTLVYDDRCAEMLGYEHRDLANQLSAWGKLVHSDDIRTARAALDDYLQGRTHSYEVEVRLRDVSGRWRKIIDRGQIVERDPDGRPVRMVGIHRIAPRETDDTATNADDHSVACVVPSRRPAAADQREQLVAPLSTVVERILLARLDETRERRS